MEKVEILKKVPLFEDLDTTQIMSIAKLIKTFKFKKGEKIIEEDNYCDSLYIIKSGKVSVTKTDADLKQQEIAVLAAADHFGEMSLLDSQPRSANVTAVEESEILEIRSSDFIQILNVDFEIAAKVYKSFAKKLSERLRSADDALLVLSYDWNDK